MNSVQLGCSAGSRLDASCEYLVQGEAGINCAAQEWELWYPEVSPIARCSTSELDTLVSEF